MTLMCLYSFFFFFQAEDGIRDWSVTGVQTCALPIFECGAGVASVANGSKLMFVDACHSGTAFNAKLLNDARQQRVIAFMSAGPNQEEIGRASCRERVEKWGGAGVMIQKKVDEKDGRV